MFSKTALFGLAAASVAVAHVARDAHAEDDYRCGPPGLVGPYHHVLEDEHSKLLAAAAVEEEITVDLVFHILAGDETREKGYLTVRVRLEWDGKDRLADLKCLTCCRTKRLPLSSP